MKKLPKLFISPVNEPILKSILKSGLPIGFILSQRQFNHENGYVSKTIIDQVLKSELIVERDHFCMEKFDKKIIAFDAEKFDMIQIDPWYFSGRYSSECIKWMHEFTESNKNIKFEFGTEDFIAKFSTLLFDIALNDITPFLDKVEYIVCQGGSVVFDCKNISPIDIEKTKCYVAKAEKYKVKVKRHNCDFHSDEELKILCDLGISAYNYAPEFTYISNSVIFDNLKLEDKTYFLEQIEKNAPWRRWLHNLENEEKTIKSCLHYLDSDDKMKEYVVKYEQDIISLVGERLEQICQIV